MKDQRTKRVYYVYSNSVVIGCNTYVAARKFARNYSRKAQAEGWQSTITFRKGGRFVA